MHAKEEDFQESIGKVHESFLCSKLDRGASVAMRQAICCTGLGFLVSDSMRDEVRRSEGTTQVPETWVIRAGVGPILD